MWSSVESDLATLLSTRVFHTLSADSGYIEAFRKAGFKGNLPTDLSRAPVEVRQQLASAATMCAQLLRMDVESKNSLRERRAKAVVLEGPETLYRLWSNKNQNRIGPWWFTQHLLNEAISDSKGDRGKALDWLRDRLAVSLDFSAGDRIASLSLGISSALPAIEAWGLPMRKYSSQALQKDPNISPQDYFVKRQESFQGQKTQYFLPFIPASRVYDHW